MLIFMQHRAVVQRLYYRSAPVGGGCQRQLSTTNHANPTNGMGFLWFPSGGVSSLKCQVPSQKGPPPLPLTSNPELHTSPRAIVPNEPNWARAPENGRGPAGRDARRRVIVQNEPNSRIEPCETNPIWLRPGGKCAKQSQTWGKWDIWAKSGVWGMVPPGVKRAKRTQFRSVKFRV
jgi:hypothetical protein